MPAILPVSRRMIFEIAYCGGHIPGAVNFSFPKGVIMDSGWDERLMEGKTPEDFKALLGSDKNRVLIFSCGRYPLRKRA